jgi:hypothetical protein
MKRVHKFTLGVCLAVFISSVPPFALAAVKSGQICSKAGVTSIAKNIKYTCIKSGKKLVWNKGVLISSTAKPKIPPSQTPTPTVTSSPSPTSAPLQRWDESERLDGLLSQFSNRVNQLANYQPEMIIEFGKGTYDDYKELINVGIAAAAKFWSADIKSPLKFPVIYSGVEDRDWFLSRIAFYGHSSPQYLENLDRRIALDGDRVGMAGLSYSNGTYLIQFFRGKALTRLYPLDYSTVSHEYSHAAQTYFLKGKMDAFPCWAMEGGANVYANIIVGLFIRNTKADEYLIRNGSVRLSLDSRENDLWTASDDQFYNMTKSMERQNSPQCTFPTKLGYSLGMLIYEQLLGKYGQAKAIAWMEASASINWQMAFENVYGVNVDDWYKNEAIPYAKAEVKKIKKEWPRD